MDNSELLRAYRLMRTIRQFEDRANDEFLAGNIPGFVHLYTGQEAIAVGICLHLRDSDYIASTHRGHGHSIAKGCDVTAMMLEIFGRADGLCRGKGGSMHIADLHRGMLGANGIVGAGPPLAIGAGLSARHKGHNDVAIAFIGDGASNQGTTFESMNMAVVLQLPVVFVFENNGYGEGTGVDYAVGSRDIASRAAGFGLPATTVDGTDVLLVHDAAAEAVERARKGSGPSVIEAQSRRFHGHFVGDAQAYRTEQEKQTLRETDCLKKFRKTVVSEGNLSADQLDDVDKSVVDEIEAAVQAARDAKPPGVEALHDDVYVSY